MTKFVTLTDGPDFYDGLLDSPLEDVYVEGLFGDDTIGGTDFNDTLLGNQDNDFITGRQGNDLVYGGQGDDTISDAFDNNILLGNFGADNITGGIDSDTIYGGPNDDTIIGNSGPNLLLGNLDNDNITGGQDEDTIYGGQGNDTISGQSGRNLLLGNKGDDNITGGQDEDTIYGGQGDDSISGDSGNNLLLGNIGDDSITGGENEDTIYGGQGLDSIVGNAGADLLLGNKGNDSISGGAGIDTIFGGAEDDSIFVLAEGDLESGESIDGGIGEDTLFVQANSSLDGVTLTSVENLVISDGIEVTSSLEQAQTFDDISGGSIGILVINDATATEIEDSGLLDNVAENVTVIDQDGNIVQEGMETGGPSNPEDPDKSRPIAATLTVGADDITLNGERADAPLENTGIGTVSTLEDGDRIIGEGEGNLLTVNWSTNSFDTLPPSPAPFIDGVQTINISTGALLGDPTLIASQISGTDTFTLSDATREMDIVDLTYIPEEFILRNSIVTMDLEFRNSTVSGNDDSIKIKLENVQASGEPGDFEAFATSSANGIETFVIESTSVDGSGSDNVIDRFSDRGSDSFDTAIIYGDQNLTVEGLEGNAFSGSVTLIDAGNAEFGVFTGNLTIGDVSDPRGLSGLSDYLRGGNANLTFIGGEGDDYVEFGDGLDGNDDVDGGGGETNTVSATFDANFDNTAGSIILSSIQELLLIFDDNTTVDFRNSDDQISSITILEDGFRDTVTIEGLNSIPSLTFEGDGDDIVQLHDSITYTSIAASGTDDTLVVNINNDGTEITDPDSHEFGGLTADAIENIELTIEDGDLTDPNNAGISSSTLSSLTVSTIGVFDVTLDNISTNGAPAGSTETIDELDFSGVEGALNIVMPVDDLGKGATVTLSQGGSMFNATGSAEEGGAANTNGIDIIGGAGVDNITDTAFDDVITGNGGNENIMITGGDDQVVLNQTDGSFDTITGFAAGDTIALSSAAYTSLAAGQNYEIVNVAGGINLTEDQNSINTIIQGTANDIINTTNTSNVEFAVVTGANSVINYSENGDFNPLEGATRIGIVDVAAFALGVSTKIVVVAQYLVKVNL